MIENLLKFSSRRSALLGGQIRFAPQVDWVESTWAFSSQFVRRSRGERFHRFSAVTASKRDGRMNHWHVYGLHQCVLGEALAKIAGQTSQLARIHPSARV